MSNAPMIKHSPSKVATIKEVSRLAGVSISTVSRVLNESGPVSEATKLKVVEVAEQLNYKPNLLARALVTNRSGGIGVSINTIASPFFGAMLEGIESALTKDSYLLVSTGWAELERERSSVEHLKEHADGIIAYFEAMQEEEIIRLSQEIPLVIMGRYIFDIAPNCVYLDNEQGGFLATSHLIEHGHKRIAHISGKLNMPDARARLQGYRQALASASIPYDERLVIEADFSELGGQRATERLLERHLNFSAIFAANDQMAAGALLSLKDKSIRIPEDISLVGYDDIILARYLSPSLTTIRQPLREMGKAAAQILLAQLDHDVQRQMEVKHKFEAELISRQSVKSL
ncbi:MAG: LacI family DNA-binding transcriptional regulator [Deinococcales bacterium]